jgi:uncharacterized protein YndB with AHSA1/START domain
MNPQNYDWTTFRKQIFIKADNEQVFRAWTTPDNIVQWFIATADYTTPVGTLRPNSETVKVGDQYHWRWHQDLEATGTVLEVVENEKLSFTFGDKEKESDEKIVVTVTVIPDDGGTTLLELIQENMPNTPEAQVSWHMGCNLGWSFFMTNLKALLEYGIDLRETDQERAYASRAITH